MSLCPARRRRVQIPANGEESSSAEKERSVNTHSLAFSEQLLLCFPTRDRMTNIVRHPCVVSPLLRFCSVIQEGSCGYRAGKYSRSVFLSISTFCVVNCLSDLCARVFFFSKNVCAIPICTLPRHPK